MRCPVCRDEVVTTVHCLGDILICFVSQLTSRYGCMVRTAKTTVQCVCRPGMK